MTRQPSRFLTTAAVALVLLAASALPAAAQAVVGTITKTGTGQQLTGPVRWQPASKTYLIRPEGMRVALEIKASEVERIQVPQPKALQPAVRQVQQGQYEAAKPVLEQVVKDYEMLQWDVPAAQYLALAHLRTKNASGAVKMCEKVLAVNERAGEDPHFAGVYWEALLENNMPAKLRASLDKSIADGPRSLAAVAQVRRGDLERKEGNLKIALLDGYLRTVVFFQSNKDVLPEALYKAAKVFEELGDPANAEKMRKRLLAQFPDDEYSKRLRSGA
jgi:tetratricopeptide (TPR) repeat protein